MESFKGTSNNLIFWAKMNSEIERTGKFQKFPEP
jgi:hypothetical protein